MARISKKTWSELERAMAESARHLGRKARQIYVMVRRNVASCRAFHRTYRCPSCPPKSITPLASAFRIKGLRHDTRGLHPRRSWGSVAAGVRA